MGYKLLLVAYRGRAVRGRGIGFLPSSSRLPIITLLIINYKSHTLVFCFMLMNQVRIFQVFTFFQRDPSDSYISCVLIPPFLNPDEIILIP